MNKKRLRGAIIGFGFISANGHIPAYLARTEDLGDVQINAVADICPVRRNLAQQALPQARFYRDYRALLHDEAANLDFVDICTPPCDHAAIAHAALAAGVHVLCEKPLTCTPEDARSLLEHAQAAQRVLFPCHNYRHAPMVQAIGDAVRAGRIGKVDSVSLNIYRNSHAMGVAEWRSHWRRDSRYSGGGIGMDHGSHSFYLTFDWLGSYPTAVTANMSNLQPGIYDTEDNFSAEVIFPTGVARVHLTWTAGMRKVIYTLRGDHGTITMEDDVLRIETTNGAPVESRTIDCHWSDASHARWFDALFDDFRSAIDRRDFAGKEAREAFLCVQLIHTAYRSARDGSRELPLAPLVLGDGTGLTRWD